MVKINKQKVRQLNYKFRHDFLTARNLLTVAAAILALSWIFSAVGAMDLNYKQQKKLDVKTRQARILELETLNLEYEQKYYQSQEYQELAIRQKLDLAFAGETALILDEYSSWVEAKEKELTQISDSVESEPTNFRKWVNFLFGGYRQPAQV